VPGGELRSILDVLDGDPFLPADLLELARWTARYYLASLAEVIAAIVPAAIPGPARERFFRLVRRLSAEDEAALARRTPGRARAYQALAASPDGLTTGEARAAGIGTAALRALVAITIAEAGERERTRPTAPSPTDRRPPNLTAAQRAAVAAIADRLAGEGGSFLLHGVTGSGKTEVFLAAAE